MPSKMCSPPAASAPPAARKSSVDFVPDYDSAVYEKLSDAGAVLMGKTGLHELAYGITNNNPHFGPVRNPHDPERIPGGSSGGSGAAVAAGMVFFAMGTRYRRLHPHSRRLLRLLSASSPPPAASAAMACCRSISSLDHMGPLTRTPRDAGLVMNAHRGLRFARRHLIEAARRRVRSFDGRGMTLQNLSSDSASASPKTSSPSA